MKGQLEWKLEVLLKEAFQRGESHRLTARRLKLAESTVRNHFYKLRVKLGTPQRQCGSPPPHLAQCYVKFDRRQQAFTAAWRATASLESKV